MSTGDDHSIVDFWYDLHWPLGGSTSLSHKLSWNMDIIQFRRHAQHYFAPLFVKLLQKIYKSVDDERDMIAAWLGEIAICLHCGWRILHVPTCQCWVWMLVFLEWYHVITYSSCTGRRWHHRSGGGHRHRVSNRADLHLGTPWLHVVLVQKSSVLQLEMIARSKHSRLNLRMGWYATRRLQRLSCTVQHWFSSPAPLYNLLRGWYEGCGQTAAWTTRCKSPGH